MDVKILSWISRFRAHCLLFKMLQNLRRVTTIIPFQFKPIPFGRFPAFGSHGIYLKDCKIVNLSFLVGLGYFGPDVEWARLGWWLNFLASGWSFSHRITPSVGENRMQFQIACSLNVVKCTLVLKSLGYSGCMQLVLQ